MHHPLLTIKSERVGIVPPPPGVTPNFTHPESRGYLIVIASIISIVLSTAVLLLRLYSRRFFVHAVNFSDYAVVVGQLSGFGFSAITLRYVANHTLGVHQWDIRISDLTLIMQLAVVQYAFLWLAIMFAKISILLFYLQLSPYRFFRVIIYGLLAVTLAYSLLGAFAFLIVCRPIRKFWELTLPGSCIDQREIWLAIAAINSATDITMVFLPVFLMWNVSIPKRTKIGVIAILMTGLFVTATSFIRLHSLVSLSHSGDLTWPVAPPIWSTIEVNVGLICANLPHVKPLLRHHFPKLLGNTSDSGTSTSQKTKNFSWAARETLASSDGYATQLHGSRSDLNGDILLQQQHPSKLKSSFTNGGLHTVAASSIQT